jgi:hypothetical protein
MRPTRASTVVLMVLTAASLGAVAPGAEAVRIVMLVPGSAPGVREALLTSRRP